MKAKTHQYGFTEVKETENSLKISHDGNMGNSIERSVDPNLKHLGYGSIKYLKKLYRKFKEEGSPDYAYSIVFDKNIRQKFD